MVDGKRFLTVHEVCDLLRINRGDRKTLLRRIRDGVLPPPSVRKGKRGRLWRASLVEDCLARQEEEAVR